MKKYILILFILGLCFGVNAQKKLPDVTRFVKGAVLATAGSKGVRKSSAARTSSIGGERDMSRFTTAPVQKGAGGAGKSAVRLAATNNSDLPSNHAAEKHIAPQQAPAAPEAVLEQMRAAEAPARKQ